MRRARTVAVIAIDRWSVITRQGIEFAALLSPEVIALHVEPNEHSELLRDDWEQHVEQPFRAAGKASPQLHLLPSPYRFVTIPTVQFILDLSKNIPVAALSHNQTQSAGPASGMGPSPRGNERIFTVGAPCTSGPRT